MNWLLDRPRVLFWLAFAVLMAPGLWRMRPPWHTEGWSTSELIVTTAVVISVKALISAALATWLTFVTRASRNGRITGSSKLSLPK